MSKKIVRLTCVFAFGGVALLAQSIVPTVVETTGMVGLAENQTARLNLLNPGVQPPATGAICSAGVTFIDGQGSVLKSATVTVSPGASGGLNLDSEVDLSIGYGARREIRAVITLPGVLPPVTATATTPPLVPACKLIPTLEIFDTPTGRTLVTLGGIHMVPSATVVTPATN